MLDVDFDGCDLRDIDLCGAQYDVKTLCTKGLLRRARVSCEMFPVDWSGMNLERADLRGCMLAHANFSNCNLAGANFDGANLHGANFQGANLTSVYLRGAAIKDAKFNNASIEGINYGHQVGDFNMWYVTAQTKIQIKPIAQSSQSPQVKKKSAVGPYTPTRAGRFLS